MVVIEHSAIPAFLHEGAFYRSLSADEPDSKVEVPDECYRETADVVDIDDFCYLLRITKFWVLDQLPVGVICFCYEHRFKEWKDDALDVLGQSELWKLLENIFYDPKDAMKEAIASGRMDIISFMVTTKPKNRDATEKAAKLGRLDLLQLLHEHNHPWGEKACTAAAANGHLDCLTYLHVNGCKWWPALYLEAGEHPECVKYAHQQGLKWHPKTIEELTKKSDAESFAYALANGCTCTPDAVLAAAKAGNAEVLRLLLSRRGFYADEKVCAYAAQGSHTECLRVLQEYNAPWCHHAAFSAAFYNQLEGLRFLHEEVNCPWDESVTRAAANNGCVETLRYAIDHGCPYSASQVVATAALAIGGSALACLKYLIGEKHMAMNADGSVFVNAFIRGDLKSVQYLMEVGCPDTPTTDEVRDRWRTIEDLTFVSDHHYVTNEQGVIERRKGSELDMKIARCIEHATGRGWKLKVAGAGLVDCITESKDKYPVSYALCA